MVSVIVVFYLLFCLLKIRYVGSSLENTDIVDGIKDGIIKKGGMKWI